MSSTPTPPGPTPPGSPPAPAAEAPSADLLALAAKFDRALDKLAQTSAFAKQTTRGPVLDIACRLLARPGGAAQLVERAERLEAAGVFHGTDWAQPEILQPSLATGTLTHGDRPTATLEMLSELRLLAVAHRHFFHPRISSEQAQHFLSQLLALNLNRLFGAPSEAERQHATQATATRNVFAHMVERIGFAEVFGQLGEEIERILAQRPIMVDDVKLMVTRIAACLNDPEIDSGASGLGAARLVSALFGPTTACREDPGLEVYAERLDTLDDSALTQEARAFARAMHDTGLVSPYHAVFLRRVNGPGADLVAQALGLSSTGREAFSCYPGLVESLIEAAITPDTAQAILGLALLLERGLLFDPAIGPSLWGHIGLTPCPAAAQALATAFGPALPPATLLLAGTLSVLGQPLGIGQGNNPTCQAARALSMWALAAPDYLLHLLARAARDDDIVMVFEGQRLSSAALRSGLASQPPMDVDPVSVVLVPHLDRIYMEMGRLCAGRPGDPHAWVNSEMHGWWVGRDTALAVDLPGGTLAGDYATFVRRFFAHYHPLHNGNAPVTHPQPAGIAVTDSLGRFIGWHAVTILRVGLGPKGDMRLYFFNPNCDGGQDWGQGVVVSTEGNGEWFGESSLPFESFASRLYLYHCDACDEGDLAGVDAETVAGIEAMARATWAAR
ncbi:hypothetical protein [Roseospirillum parvum]|uniref:Uncharacterized protein n=1 Tax=Roseospirillum parvum TaxID=83401 RepID=A0A1G8CU76_9PROT|nr:hypothetical protein [Roseospirillum parvum]SDH48998.1 hypothetical protein SAMN05421742_107100 [Roseospirillum parvum]